MFKTRAQRAQIQSELSKTEHRLYRLNQVILELCDLGYNHLTKDIRVETLKIKKRVEELNFQWMKAID